MPLYRCKTDLTPQQSGVWTVTTGNAVRATLAEIVMNSKTLHLGSVRPKGRQLGRKEVVPFQRLLLGLLENYVIPQALNNKGKYRSLLLTFLPQINYCANYVYLSI